MSQHKVVYNARYGGFGLSEEAIKFLATRKGINLKGMEDYYRNYAEEDFYESRHDPDLVACVETLGSSVNNKFSKLCIKVIDSDRYFIKDYDGLEMVITPDLMEKRWIKITDDNIMKLQDVHCEKDFSEFYQKNNLVSCEEKINFLTKEMGILYSTGIEDLTPEEELKTLELHVFKGWDRKSYSNKCVE